MSVIKPFRALRPPGEMAKDVSSVPYDVLSIHEAREIAENNPSSFLRVSRSEIELTDDISPYSDDVYARARQNFEEFQNNGKLAIDDEPGLYVYRLQMGEQIQTSIVACCSIDEYDGGLIKKHEKTRPDKENDRTRHMIELEAQTGLIFLCYRGTDEIDTLVAQTCSEPPIYDFEAEDVNSNSIRHTVWKMSDPNSAVKAFERIPAIYIADGHHRAASSARARNEMKSRNPDHTGQEEYNFVIAALFPAGQLKIMAYNRVVKDLNGLDPEGFLSKLREAFEVSTASTPNPAQRGTFSMYLDGKWFLLRPKFPPSSSTIESLDVSVLENHVLHPILGIEDVRTDKRIDFVGGIRGTSELEKLVDSGKWEVAFSMFPTTVEQLLSVSDEDHTMPPKSTWFEPKLRDGLLIHEI